MLTKLVASSFSRPRFKVWKFENSKTITSLQNIHIRFSITFSISNYLLFLCLFIIEPYLYFIGERGCSVVECRTPKREVGGSKPTSAVLCPWARHFTPRKYWLITQEAVAPSRHDWKIVDWDVKPQLKQIYFIIQTCSLLYLVTAALQSFNGGIFVISSLLALGPLQRFWNKTKAQNGSNFQSLMDAWVSWLSTV